MNTIIKNIAKALIFALPAVALVVPTYMFFPFITGKAFLFRVAVELAFFLYVALAISDSEYRPKWNALTIAFTAFTAIIFLADAFAINPFKAFWSNFERMEGFVTLGHLFAYFLAASSILRTKKDWRIWMFSVIAISVYMSFFCFLQLAGEATINQGGVRVDGAMGNAAYLAAYLIFHIFFLIFLWIDEELDFRGIGTAITVGASGYSIYYLWRIAQAGATHTHYGIVIFCGALLVGLVALTIRLSRGIMNKWGMVCSHITYALVLLAYFVLLYETATRGAILGLIGGFIIGLVFLVTRSGSDKAVRNVCISVLVTICVFIGAFYVLKNSPLVQNSPVLSRFASISWDEAKGQARNFIWPMAIKGAIEHPVLGWGQEGFSYVFQKYYVPVMITQEPWFDRAHNAFLDWLVAGGFPGFLAYLSLYIISIIFIWRSTVFSNKEKAVLLGLIAAYAFQNIFIFDNIMSYIFFASFLAFVSARHIEAKVENSNKSDSEINIATLTVCAIAFVAVMLLLNAKGFLQNTTLINAMTPQKLGVEQNFTLLKQAIGDGAMGTYEAREQLIRITQQVVSAPNVSNETKLAFANETVSQMDKQLTETPQDARAFLEFGDFLVNIGAFDQAIPQLEKAKALSPEKQQTAFTLVRAYIGKGLSAKDPKQMDEALSIMKEAYELAPNVDASRLPYISALLVAGKAADAVNIIDEVNDPSPLMNVTLIKSMTAAGFKDDAIKLLKRQISLDSQNADAYVLLSNVYVDAKDSKDAISILEDMSAAIPSQKDEADKDIATIKAGLK